MKKIFLLFIFIFFFALLQGCKEGDNSASYSSSNIGLDGSEWYNRVNVELSTYSGFVGNSIMLTVSCVDKVGAPIKDVKVTFSSDNGGTFESRDLDTDESGSVSNIFTPTKEGETEITVSALGHNTYAMIMVYKAEAFTKPVMLYVSSDTVNANGTLLVQVFVNDGTGTAVKDATIDMHCNYGSFSSASDKTDESGWFSTTYTASSTVGVDVITAMSMGNVATATVSIQ